MNRNFIVFINQGKLLFLIIFILNLKSLAQQTDGFKKLKNLVESQIKKDSIRQKDIINITLAVEINENKFKGSDQLKSIDRINEFNKSLKSSTSFDHMGGYYLRLYLVASDEFSNDAKLELVRDNSSDNKPDQIIETLFDSASDLKVSSFDYHISKHSERFSLTIRLDEMKAGRAFALVTVISDKEYCGKKIEN